MTSEIRKSILRSHPSLFRALSADVRVTLDYRGEASGHATRLRTLGSFVRLLWVTDAFFGQVCYRVKTRLQRFHVPLLPRIIHHLAMRTAQICIGDPVVIEPGIYIAHGQVVIDGFSTVSSGVVLFPWVTIGLRAGDFAGPTIGEGAQIGTGAKIIGPVTVGAHASVGANAVVVKDVAPGTTVVGIPAKVVSSDQA